MRISYSAYDTYQRCPAKYKYQFIDKISVPKKAELEFGSLIHKIVQEALKRDPIIPPFEDLVTMLGDLWPEDTFASELESKQYFDLGQNMLRSFHASLMPGLRNIVAVEKYFQIPLNDKHVLSGVIDRIDKLPFGAFEVIDYKTGKTLPTQDDVDEDRQLGLYNFAVANLWPEAKDVRLTLYFLKHDQQLTTKRVENQTKEIIDNIIQTADEIEKEKEWQPKRNAFCNWCEYRNLCPAQKNRIKKGLPPEIEAVIEKYIDAQELLTELETKIHSHFDKAKIETFHHKKGIVTRSKTKKISIKIS